MSGVVPGELHRTSTKAVLGTIFCVLLLTVCLTWTYFSMRSVMGVGGACADGGPYVSANPCPDGSWLIAPAVPVMMLTAMVGTAVASAVNAPNLLLPMWAFLFASLGWNFFEFALKGDDVVISWIVCGVLFWLMAAPAVWAVLVAVKNAVLPPDDQPPPRAAERWWVPAYAALGAVGLLFGAWTYALIAG